MSVHYHHGIGNPTQHFAKITAIRGVLRIVYWIVSARSATILACNQSNSCNYIAQRLNELSSQQPLSSLSIDWLEERRHVERIARNIVGNRRAMDLAVDECKRYLGEVQEGASFESHIKSLVQHYLVRVYDARFQYRTPLNNHRNGIDQIVFLERLNEVRPYVITTLQSWADFVVRSRNLDHLRATPRNLTPRVEADTNLPQWR